MGRGFESHHRLFSFIQSLIFPPNYRTHVSLSNDVWHDSSHKEPHRVAHCPTCGAVKPQRVSEAGISPYDHTVVSSYAEPLQAPPPPSTNYGSPSYGLPPQTPYPLLNPYDPYAAPLPPPRRHVKLGMLIGIVVLVLVFVIGGVFAFLIQGTKRDTHRQTP